MKPQFIKSNEKRHIVEKLKENYGIDNVPFLLIQAGREKVRAFSGHLSKEEIALLADTVNIEFMGLYLVKEEHEQLRVSFDATHILSSQIKKKILDLTDEQFKLWIRGHDLDIKFEKGDIVLRYKGDFLGSGKSNGEKIFNYVPKDRRLRK